MSADPYSPPDSPPDDERISEIECPACGSTMQAGSVSGSLDWLSPESPKLERFLGGRKVLGPSSFSLTVSKQRTPAFLCEACGVILVQPKR